jgi:branched-subunit amino acid transport protein
MPFSHQYIFYSEDQSYEVPVVGTGLPAKILAINTRNYIWIIYLTGGGGGNGAI